MLGVAPMSIPAAFSPPLAIRPLRPFGNLATPLPRHTGVCLHAPPPSPGFYAIRRRSALRSSSPSSSLAERDGDADADFRGFGRAFAALLSALESRLLSVHDRLSRKRFERVAVAGVLLGLLTAVLRAAVGTSAHLFGALARIVGSAGGGPQEGGVSENVVGEGEVEEIAGEVPPLWELTAQHLAATKYGGRRASQREVEAMGVVRERVLGLTEGDKEAMDRAWVDSLTPVDLLRYVRGNGGEGRTAAEKLLATAVWRKDFGVTGILEEEETTIDAFFEGKVPKPQHLHTPNTHTHTHTRSHTHTHILAWQRVNLPPPQRSTRWIGSRRVRTQSPGARRFCTAAQCTTPRTSPRTDGCASSCTSASGRACTTPTIRSWCSWTGWEAGSATRTQRSSGPSHPLLWTTIQTPSVEC
mmetsp:Transcript_7268/g.18590  ORF Transcript_7268/g.18590 Transcript_7268/m.18590 type:complete len:414 (-) Transcript_7268:210-1451(-)